MTASGKTCSQCGERKPFTEFHRDRSRPDGRRSACRSCSNIRPIHIVDPGFKWCPKCETPKPLAAFSKSRYALDGLQHACRQCQALTRSAAYHQTDERERRRRGRDATAERGRTLKKRYGLTAEQYDEMAAAQSGRCAICGKTPDYFLVVDHDHATGRTRGLLCSGCNTGLHMIEAKLEAALRYLDAYR